MDAKHKCGFGFELHQCEDRSCTLNRLAESVGMIADLFVPAEGPCCGLEDKTLSESAARHFAQLLGEIREAVWCYDRPTLMWQDNLAILDLVEDLLKTQYRIPERAVVHVTELEVWGIAHILHIVERNLRTMAEEGTV